MCDSFSMRFRFVEEAFDILMGVMGIGYRFCVLKQGIVYDVPLAR